MKQGEIWLADLNPPSGTEPGKIRPVVIVQSNLLNGFHPSTIICPITTQVEPDTEILRIHLNDAINKLGKKSDVIVDQVRAIDNRRLLRRKGILSSKQLAQLKTSLRIVMDLL